MNGVTLNDFWETVGPGVVAGTTQLKEGDWTVSADGLTITITKATITSKGLNWYTPDSGAGVGTVTVGAGTTAWVGVGTQFLTTFKVGDTITSAGQTKTIATITNDTNLTTDAVVAGIAGQAYTLAPNRAFRLTTAAVQTTLSTVIEAQP